MLYVLLLALIAAAGLWLFFGHSLSGLIGPHRNRHSNIESWDKTAPITTRQGRIIGLQAPESTDGAMAFLGIRYGEAPVGEKRFLPAVASGAWDGTFEATRFPNAPVQATTARGTTEPNMPVQSEDCLFLSVYTPSTEGDHRPVLFWIHGGAFLYGTGNGYPGHVLAEQGDVVVVSINYRLGILGFCDLSMFGEDYAGSGSLGIRDQILALEWVRDNIADYGGDAGNVMIFGESAGGSSVSSLLAAPAADGLFHKAIIQSGMSVAQPPTDYTDAIRKHLKLDPDADIPAALRKLSEQEILKLQTRAQVFGGGQVDGTVITRSLKDTLLAGGKPDVPIIVGTNRDEGTLFSMIVPRFAYKPFVPGIAGAITDEREAPDYIARLKQDYPKDSAKEHFERVWTEGFRSSAVLTAEWAARAGRDVWLYRLDEPVQYNPFAFKLGATHAAEMEITFNSFAREDLPEKSHWYLKEDADIRKLGLDWSNTVIQFARTGNPNGAGMPEWPQYSNSEKECLVLQKQPYVASSLDTVELERWREFRADGAEIP